MKKGSISVYLCLILSVLLVLIFACFDSVRFSGGRAAVTCALDEGLFSLFSKYDKTIYDKYGLLVIDAGYGSGDLRVGRLLEAVEADTKRVLKAAPFGSTPEKLYRIDIERKSVTGYVLATDSGYAPLEEQICELMKIKLGADGIAAIANMASGTIEDVSTFSKDDEKDMDSLIEQYESEKLASEARAEEAAQAEIERLAGAGGHGSSAVVQNITPEVPKDFENPIDTVTELKKKTPYENAVSGKADVSTGAIDKNTLVSARDLKHGMGLMPMEENGLDKKLLISEYAISFFPNYVSKNKDEVFAYQTEYIIAGKAKDKDNLSSVINRIMLIREGFNYMYLMTSPARQAEVHETAAIISAILINPELEPIIAQAVTLCWAYGESLVDVKNLLDNKKVPLFKDDTTWQVSLGSISRLSGDGDSAKGMTYKDYLRILMYMTAEDDVMARIADMIEYNKRQIDSQPGFSLDCCVTALEVELETDISGHSTRVKGSYSYSD